LNFNASLDRFEKVDITGVRNLATFALSTRRQSKPFFIFVSSISSVMDIPGHAIPEQSINDATAVTSQPGYGKAKFIAERILDRAAKQGLNVAIVRCGQLAGNSVTGAWNSKEYIPILLQTCQTLGFIPEHFQVS
jgi:thioester reductase-like protein